MRAILLVGACIAFTGCFYETPTPSKAPLTLTVPKDAAAADGSEIVDLKVALSSDSAPGTVVHLEVSSGVLSFAADPTSAEARQLDVKFTGAGAITVPLQVGTVPGPLLIRATAGDFTDHGSLKLVPATVKRVALSLDRGRVRADGVTPITATAQLFAEGTGTRVSNGTPVNFAICCVGDQGQMVPCTGPTLLNVPPFATVTTGDTASIRAVPSVVDSAGEGGSNGAAPDFSYFIAASIEAPDCSAGTSDQQAAAMVTVIPEP